MGKVTKEQIKKWKTKYGEVKEVVLPAVEREGKEVIKEAVFYLKKPDRKVIKFAMSKQVSASGVVDVHSPGEVILDNCYLGGDDVKTENCYFFRACREGLGDNAVWDDDKMIDFN